MLTSSKAKNRRSVFIALMLLPAILLPLVFSYYPMLRGSLMAFKDYNLLTLREPEWIGLGNFVTLFTKSPGNTFYATLKNTVIWVAVSLFFQFTIGLAMALLLKKRFRGSGLYQGLIFFPWAVSGFIIGIMWRWMFNGTAGVINDILIRLCLISEPVSWLARSDTSLYACIIANIWYGIPYFTIMITAALRGVPQDLYEAAGMDGANPIQQFFHITIPSIRSTLLLTVLLRSIWIFNFPDLIHSMTQGGPAGSSSIITSYMMQLVSNLKYGMASAVGVLCILIEIMFVAVYLKVSKYGKEA